MKQKIILFCFNSLIKSKFTIADSNGIDTIMKKNKENKHIFYICNYTDKYNLYFHPSLRTKNSMKEFNNIFKNFLFISEKVFKGFGLKYLNIILMERMSSFYEAIINNSKIAMELFLCKSLLSFLFERSDIFLSIKKLPYYSNIKEKKQLELEKEKKLLEEKIEKYKNQKKELIDNLKKNEKTKM